MAKKRSKFLDSKLSGSRSADFKNDKFYYIIFRNLKK